MAELRINATPITLDDPEKLLKMVTFEGQLDESNADDEAQKIYKIIADNAEGTSYIFDLNDLTYLNSKAIGYLTDFYHKITERRGHLILARPRENISDIFDVVGIARLIPLASSLDDAKLQMMKMEKA